MADARTQWIERQEQIDAREGRDPNVSDLHAEHDQRLAEQDRQFEKAPRICVEQPSDRERELHRRDEREARLTLYPDRPADSQVTSLPPLTRCDCGAWETGYKHPGHKYRCPRYSKHRRLGDAA